MNGQRGFTLIEVLITLVVFAIGLLTVAGLQTISKKANYDALQRTTASLLAHDIMERMRANSRALAEYESAIVGRASIAEVTPDCVTVNCNRVQLARRDLYDWERALDGASE
ncbi:MAG: type IV pilus modification protein PilV, partial [Xanthomonadaceae bacterium]|nr:type IV pilus modification protein PilV [Xanthomonadaceae bacterium]